MKIDGTNISLDFNLTTTTNVYLKSIFGRTRGDFLRFGRYKLFFVI